MSSALYLKSIRYAVVGYAKKVTEDIVVDSKLKPTAQPGSCLLPRK